eukprot:TRINITY_DN2837_c0_g2_i1.p1 TRINITY_DN2837_c0_g2~~TRINITY_DN2837_c0_g2_i1.p1  ORF type:complete len:1103 (+),score=327.60 TRINITY_DN2837_c0_g2_i1:523-3831(+)
MSSISVRRATLEDISEIEDVLKDVLYFLSRKHGEITLYELIEQQAISQLCYLEDKLIGFMCFDFLPLVELNQWQNLFDVPCSYFNTMFLNYCFIDPTYFEEVTNIMLVSMFNTVSRIDYLLTPYKYSEVTIPLPNLECNQLANDLNVTLLRRDKIVPTLVCSRSDIQDSDDIIEIFNETTITKDQDVGDFFIAHTIIDSLKDKDLEVVTVRSKNEVIGFLKIQKNNSLVLKNLKSCYDLVSFELSVENCMFIELCCFKNGTEARFCDVLSYLFEQFEHIHYITLQVYCDSKAPDYVDQFNYVQPTIYNIDKVLYIASRKGFLGYNSLKTSFDDNIVKLEHGNQIVAGLECHFANEDEVEMIVEFYHSSQYLGTFSRQMLPKILVIDAFNIPADYYFFTRYLLQEALRFSSCVSCAYFSNIDTKLPDFLNNLQFIQPRNVGHIPSGNSTLNKHCKNRKYPLCPLQLTTKSLLTIQQQHINKRLVFVGASETTLGAIEELLLHSTYVRYNCIFVCSTFKFFCPYHAYHKDKFVDMNKACLLDCEKFNLPSDLRLYYSLLISLSYSPTYIERLGIYSRITQIEGKLTSLQTNASIESVSTLTNKRTPNTDIFGNGSITINDSIEIKYDELVLTVGDQDPTKTQLINTTPCDDIINLASPSNPLEWKSTIESLLQQYEEFEATQQTRPFQIVLLATYGVVFGVLQLLLEVGFNTDNIVVICPLEELPILTMNPNLNATIFEHFEQQEINVLMNSSLINVELKYDCLNAVMIERIKDGESMHEILPCDYLITFADEDISVDFFNVVDKAGLLFDGGALIGPNFQTSDEHIYAAGKCANFRKFLKVEQTFAEVSAREVGNILGKSLNSVVNPFFADDEKLPSFNLNSDPKILAKLRKACPIFSQPQLSGCLTYERMIIVAGYAVSPYLNEDVIFDNIFTDSAKGIVSITCDQKTGSIIELEALCAFNSCLLCFEPLQHLLCLVNMNEANALLRENFLYNSTENCILEYFEKNSYRALFLDWFKDLQELIRHDVVNEPAFEIFYSKFTELLNDGDIDFANDLIADTVKEMSDNVNTLPESVMRSVQRNIVGFLKTHKFLLNMYATSSSI